MRAQVNSSHSLLPATSLRLTAPPPDGGVYAATVFDVLFLLLPVLEHHRQKARCRPFQVHTCALLHARALALQTETHAGRYCSAEHVLEDAQWPALVHLRPAAEKALPAVCSVQQVGEELFFRLDDARLLAWLTLKVDAVMTALRAGAAAGLAFEALDDAALRAYAVDLLSEYLTPGHLARLRTHLGCEATAPTEHAGAPAGVHAVAQMEEQDGKRLRPAPPMSTAAKQAASRAANIKEKNAKAAKGTVSLASFFGKPPAK